MDGVHQLEERANLAAGVGGAEVTLNKAVGLEPRDGEAGVGVEVTFLFGKDFVEDLVDPLQGIRNRHWFPVGTGY